MKPDEKNDLTKAAPSHLTRRRFLQGVGAVGAGAMIGDAALLRADPQPDNVFDSSKPSAQAVEITLDLNGAARKVTVEPRTTLLSAVRDRLDPAVTGPKLVCDMGACGACTVLMNGKPVYACMVLAVDAVGQKLTTVEGLGSADHLDPLQEAFVENDALMCGFCTPGFVTTMSAYLKVNPNPTLEQVREACHGNFCRCGTYTRIFKAALDTAKAQAGKQGL